jgi:hypothetical protein
VGRSLLAFGADHVVPMLSVQPLHRKQQVASAWVMLSPKIAQDFVHQVLFMLNEQTCSTKSSMTARYCPFGVGDAF